METNSDVNPFDEEVRAEANEKLTADSCMKCEQQCNDCMRPGGLCDNRPCGFGPNYRPGMNPGMRPNMRPNMRPGFRPNKKPVGPCGARPCGGRPGMRPDGRLPEGWRPSDGMRSNSLGSDSELHSEWNCKTRMIQDAQGRSMIIGCEGQTMSGCHMNDPMDRLGDAFPPVMAFVPWQQWGDLYEPECGLKQGTIFKDLNYIFCGTRC